MKKGIGAPFRKLDYVSIAKAWELNYNFIDRSSKMKKKLTDRLDEKLMNHESDHTVNYLGYWTDQGAYYYYNTEPNKTYGETMMDIYDNYSGGPQKLPIRHWNYDSWWYYKV